MMRYLPLLLLPLLMAGCGVVSQTKSESNAGALAFDVEPDDAVIYVDGRAIGEAGDFDGEDKVLEIPSGRHKIEIKAEGCRPFYQDIYSSYSTDTIRVRLECQD